MPEVHENAAEIFVVFLYPMVEAFYLRLGQKTQHVLFQLTLPLAGDDLYQSDPLTDRLLDDPVKLIIDQPSLIKNIMKIQSDLSHGQILGTLPTGLYCPRWVN